MLRRLFALKSRPRQDIDAITPSEAERAEALIAEQEEASRRWNEEEGHTDRTLSEQKRKNLDAAVTGAYGGSVVSRSPFGGWLSNLLKDLF